MLEIVELYLSNMLENKGKSIRTVRNYRSILKRYALYLVQIGKAFTDVETMEIEAYTGPILHKAGVGPARRSTVVSAVRGFYQYCIKRNLISRNPAQYLEHPRFGKPLPNILSLEDIEKLMWAPDLSTLQGLRDAAILSLIFATGCRVSGLVSLNEDQLVYGGQEESPRLYVILREKGKKERKIPVERKAEILLFSYLKSEALQAIDRNVGATKVVFINLKNTRTPAADWRGEKRRMTEKSIGQIIKKYGRRVGIPEERLHPHAGRHSVGTQLIDDGMDLRDLQLWLGHEKLQTVYVYVHLSEKRLLKGAQTGNPLSKVKTPIDELARSVFAPDKVIKKS